MAEPFRIGPWTVTPATGAIQREGQGLDDAYRLEPKVMALFVLLAEQPGAVLSRADIEAAIWADVVVAEDTVARSISKLRRALGDSTREPTFIETIPKRGYRLLLPVEPVTSAAERTTNPRWVAVLAVIAVLVLGGGYWMNQTKDEATPTAVAGLTARADNLYMRFTRADNEAALALYEQALNANSEDARAQAGLANALVQRVMRWQSKDSSVADVSIQSALAQGVFQTSSAQETLQRATNMAERAARLEPHNADVLKALGLVYSANGQLDRAQAVYLEAIELDAQAWEAMVNLSEIYLINDQPEQSIALLERAYASMDRVYADEPQKVGPWQAAFGVLIGERKELSGDQAGAELWYRRALSISPYEPEATSRLAVILRASGEAEQAERLCAELVAKVGGARRCGRD